MLLTVAALSPVSLVSSFRLAGPLKYSVRSSMDWLPFRTSRTVLRSGLAMINLPYFHDNVSSNLEFINPSHGVPVTRYRPMVAPPRRLRYQSVSSEG
ncbi:hypothetical protein GCM10023075_57170 [Streptosporangium album]